MRKDIERVFGMLKKRFRILKIPLPCHNIFQITDILHSCCILHNMILEDKDRIDLGQVVIGWSFFSRILHSYRVNLENTKNILGEFSPSPFVKILLHNFYIMKKPAMKTSIRMQT